MKFLLLLTLSFFHLYALSYTITAKELNENIKTKFPIERAVLFSKFVFSNPLFTLSKKSNEVHFECDAYNPDILMDNGEVAIFRVSARSGISYHDGKIFLTEVHIDKISNADLSKELEQKFIMGAELLLQLYFSKKPIYTLEETNPSVPILKSMINDIIISDGVIKIRLLS